MGWEAARRWLFYRARTHTLAAPSSSWWSANQFPNFPHSRALTPTSLPDQIPPLFSPGAESTRSDRAIAMADEEPVDPKKYLEERCKPNCVKPFYAYEKCVKRVEADDTGHKHCTGQYFDYLSCVDKCVASKLFEKLK
ncbi:hypothetical protein ACQ4PT_017745 [Festuca glaucescens]